MACCSDQTAVVKLMPTRWQGHHWVALALLAMACMPRQCWQMRPLLPHASCRIKSDCGTFTYSPTRGERIVFLGPNTNTNTIRVKKFVRIRIQILFGLRNLSEYEYEYYSGSELWPNTNTNTIQVQKFGRIRIRILRLFE